MVPSAAIAGAMLRPGRCSPHAAVGVTAFAFGLGGHGGLAPGTTVPRAGTNWGSKLMKHWSVALGGLAGAIRSTYLTLETESSLATLTSQLSNRTARLGAGATARSIFQTL